MVPPEPMPPEVITEFVDNCHEPLFMSGELNEWISFFDNHSQLYQNYGTPSDSTLFEGLYALPLANPLFDQVHYFVYKLK